MKAILATQEQAFRAALEIFMKQVKEEVNSLQVTTQELAKSLEFTQNEVDELKQKVNQCEEEDEKNKTIMKKLNEVLSTREKHI